MNVPTDTKEGHGANEPNPEEQTDAGLSGEGAASALAHMISRRQQRHPTGEADDAAGSRHQ
jgi:hypothetical protein